MDQSTFEQFEVNVAHARTQLVWRRIPADLETPVSAYLKLAQGQDYAFLLESVEGGATLGRYSAIGLDPDFIWQGQAGDKNTLEELRAQVAACKIDEVPDHIPPMGPSGLFGYMSYDMVRLVEDIPDSNPDPIGIADSILIRPTVMVVFDNVKHEMCLVTPVRETSGDPRALFDRAQARLDRAMDMLRSPLPSTALHHDTALDGVDTRSNMSEEHFFSMVDKAADYIRAGDIFQVVLAQRFSAKFDLPPFELYRALRRMNPSPFLFFIQMKDFALVGSSPEILVRVRDGKVTIRPIAGTRPRGQTPEQDAALEKELLADQKECAEHLMLLDLGRNDVGRVAEIGSVAVTEKFCIERYSHVMHIVSNVEGRLKQGKDSLDALMAGFPAGTVSGAPKVRAMEIIDELEPDRRGFYGGCIGYLAGNGDVDTCIALRTGLVKDGVLHVTAGAGIVADSIPKNEFQETVNKAKAVLSSAEQAIAQARAVRAQAR